MINERKYRLLYCLNIVEDDRICRLDLLARRVYERGGWSVSKFITCLFHQATRNLFFPLKYELTVINRTDTYSMIQNSGG